MRIHWLDEGDVKKLLNMSKAITAVEEAFKYHALKKVQMPPKIYLSFSKYGGDLRAMPAYIEPTDIAGVKIVNVHPANPERGLPTVMAVLVLNDPRTGAPLSIMGGTYLTDMRTGAAGGVAVKYLARKDSKVLGIVGAGRQAKTQLRAIALVADIEEVKVASRSLARRKKFISEMRSTVSCDIFARSIKEVCDCDILVTTTPVREPIVKDAWISEGTHINAIGADAEGKEELEPELLKRAKIVVDDISQASHSGEVNVPLSRGIITPEDIFCEIGEIVSGSRKGRKSESEITVFDSTGLAVQDVAVGSLVYTAAVKKGIGKKINLF
ncbi:MAG: alanine dehydrogenase [Candidatus Hydrothermarchaeaceae archaeon]